MKFLLDTCTFLWLNSDPDQLSSKVKEYVLDEENELCLSVASVIEISIKYNLKKLKLPEPPDKYVVSRREILNVGSLALDEIAAANIYKLPDIHNDPYDRIIISQAIYSGLIILTPDPEIIKYPVQVEW